MPPEYNFACQDEDGTICVAKTKPKASKNRLSNIMGFWNRIDQAQHWSICLPDGTKAEPNPDWQNSIQERPKSITMKKATETAIKVGAITLLILALLLLLSGKANAQIAYLNTEGYVVLSSTPTLPGPSRLKENCWQEVTQWGFQDATTFPTPDTLMATPITLSDQHYLVQYDGPNQNLYVRKVYIINGTTWLTPCKATKLGHSGTTFDAIPAIELYYDLGRLTFHDFCEHEGVLQTPSAKQYYQTCVEFVDFIKNLEQ